MGAVRELERAKAARRKLLSTSAVVAGHAALFVALAIPRLHPIRPVPAAVDVDLVGPAHWSRHGQGAAAIPPPRPLVATPNPPAPPPPALATEQSKVPPPMPTPLVSSKPISQPDSVFALAARMILQTDPTSALVAQLTEPLQAAPPLPEAVMETSTAQTVGGSAACEIGGALQTALQVSQPVQDALNRIPRPAKSVANAILLWDGRWVDAASVGGDAAIGPVKAAILEGVLSATPGCRQQVVSGPRFIIVTQGANTTLLALGSGTWRWADLLDAPTANP